MKLSYTTIFPALEFAVIGSALAGPLGESADPPQVTLNYGTFRGFNSAGGTVSFLGIAFAEPPVGQLRFNNPVPPRPFSGVRNATWFGNACPQQPSLAPNEPLPNNPGLSGVLQYLEELQPASVVTNASEDCLYLNVVRPASASAGDELPVVVWMYGGGFANGDASAYNGTQIVTRSLGLKSPVVYVSFNYRVNAFGFLGGKEVKAAGLGNFGLYDQRLALEWVQKYIYTFGGSPDKVILWGQSAGSISVMLQMVAFDGQLNGLFRGAVMESGTAGSSHDITFPGAQDTYDFIVKQTNCTSVEDTLKCLREVPYESLIEAVLGTTPLLSYLGLGGSVWKPLVDGTLLKQTIRESLKQDKYARVATIVGNVDDEGTIFSLYSFNVTTDSQFLEYIRTNFLPGATGHQLAKLAQLYLDNSTLGSPYDVGTNDTLSPQYKRIASFQGDFFFQEPRRYALRYLSRTQNVWSYLWKRNKYVPGIASFHGSDLQEFYDITGTSDWVGTDALINFAYALDPNVHINGYPSGAASSVLSTASWPRFHLSSPQLLTFEDPDVLTITNDTFRDGAIAFLNAMQERLEL